VCYQNTMHRHYITFVTCWAHLTMIVVLKVTVYSIKCVGRINYTICFFSNRNKEFQQMCCGSNTTFHTCLFSVKNNNCSWMCGPQYNDVLQKHAAKNQTNWLLNPHNFNTNNSTMKISRSCGSDFLVTVCEDDLLNF